jgi:hypothetical protein
MKITDRKHIEVRDLDKLVRETYGRPYSLQQQDGCQERGSHDVTVPDDADDFEATEIPEVVNGEVMGVSFAAWLARDPKLSLSGGRKDDFGLGLFWERNFYPALGMVLNDLHARGLLEAGKYVIDIDW